MANYFAGEYDVAVIGAGHAGCEAALASARLGMKTIIFTINLDAIGNMPCNPCIGGTAKGHIVREIDALGGEMGRVADATLIQSRMLNKGKGPAVYSLRVQSDRRAYQEKMKQTLEAEPNLDVKQCEVTKILHDENNRVTGVVTHLGAEFAVKAVIIASGTYLRGKIYVGDVAYESGPDGMFAANKLTESLTVFKGFQHVAVRSLLSDIVAANNYAGDVVNQLCICRNRSLFVIAASSVLAVIVARLSHISQLVSDVVQLVGDVQNFVLDSSQLSNVVCFLCSLHKLGFLIFKPFLLLDEIVFHFHIPPKI